jgi:multidrug efflux pump subunit AcrB
VQTQFPQAFVKFVNISIGPATAAKIEARVSGPDPDRLRDISRQIMAVFDAEADAVNVRQDCYERTRVLNPIYDESAMRRLGISETDLNRAIKGYLGGVSIGLYRDGSDVLPIVARLSDDAPESPEKLLQLQVYSPCCKTTSTSGRWCDAWTSTGKTPTSNAAIANARWRSWLTPTPPPAVTRQHC